MTYTATISSKGQITIPIEARRKLGLGKKISLELEADRLIIKQNKTMTDAWEILDKPPKPQKLSSREQRLSEVFTKKDKAKRGN